MRRKLIAGPSGPSLSSSFWPSAGICGALASRKHAMPNPVIAEVTRGGLVESRHAGAYAVVDASGKLIASAGDIAQAIFPRSAIKAFQCLPVIESGAADRFGFTDEELALACASYSGETR